MQKEDTHTREYIHKGVCFQIIRFERDFAILKNANSEICWPIEEIPEGAKIGHEVRLKLIKTHPPESEKNEKYIALRQLLEELIN